MSQTIPSSSSNTDAGGKDTRASVAYRLPSEEVIRQASEVNVYNADGQPVVFKSLYDADDGQRKRVMIIFIRHFFCGLCQEYLKALTAGISLAALPADVSIVIVGCGAASLISSYIQNLGFEKAYPFAIYADQSKRLYELFEMQCNLDRPPTPAKYFQKSLMAVVARSAVQAAGRIWHSDAGSGGPVSQNGGEMLYVTGAEKPEVTWCHRMMNCEDHAEIDELRTVLKLDEKAAPAA